MGDDANLSAVLAAKVEILFACSSRQLTMLRAYLAIDLLFYVPSYEETEHTIPSNGVVAERGSCMMAMLVASYYNHDVSSVTMQIIH